MTSFENHQDRTTLQVDHDAHGCTVLSINPNDDKNNPVVYGIPSVQLPAVLFDMTGGEPTPEEQQRALDFLNDPDVSAGGMEALIATVRETLLALHIRTQAVAAQEADGPDYSAADDLVDAQVHDPLDDMSRDQLLAEAKNMREGYTQMMRDLETAREETHTANRQFQDVVGSIGNAADTLAALASRLREGDRRA